jgi:3-methyladenine DNA glycosylase AlkD
MKKNHPLVLQIQALFDANRNAFQAPRMAAYMKNLFPYYGLQKPVRAVLQKSFIDSSKALSMEDVHLIVRQLWALPERELQYLAMDTLYANKRKWNDATLDLFEELVVTKSWWDTVDLLASKMIGPYIKKDYDKYRSRINNYMRSKDMWLNRTAIIHQLTYRSDIKLEVLETSILNVIHQKEFFLQKAIGWSLRQHAKTDANYVQAFVSTHHQMSNLAKREALKHIL